MERRLVAAALVAWAASVIAVLAVSAPLHGDEATYALLARGDAPDWLYRSRGVVALARFGIALGGSEPAMRAANAILGFGVILAVAALGRVVGRDCKTVGAWVAAVIAGAHPFALRSAELLGDVPASAALIGAIALALAELSRESGPRYRLAVAAPLLAASFYLRYGNVLTIAIVAIASIAFWWRGVVRRPGPLILTAALAGVLAAPFVAMSMTDTGSPLAILELGQAVAGRAPPGDGYFTSNPFVLYGVLAAPLAIAGLVHVARVRARAHAYLAAIAIAQLVSLGAVTHAEPRYAFVATALLVVVGVAAIAPHLANRIPHRLALAAVALAWLSCPPMVVYRQARVATDTAAEGAAIRADAAGVPCEVLALATPQVAWYSGCRGAKLSSPAALPDELDGAAGVRWYAADVRELGALDPETLARTTHTTPVELAPGAWRLDRGMLPAHGR